MKLYHQKLKIFIKLFYLLLLRGCVTTEISASRLNRQTRKNSLSNNTLWWVGGGAALGAGLLVSAVLINNLARPRARVIGEEFGTGAIDGMAQGLTIQHPALKKEADSLIEHIAEKTIITTLDLLKNKYQAEVEAMALRMARLIVEDQRRSSWPLRLFLKKQRL